MRGLQGRGLLLFFHAFGGAAGLLQEAARRQPVIPKEDVLLIHGRYDLLVEVEQTGGMKTTETSSTDAFS